jgi:molybdenum cofactor cytidylyltransferase
LKVPADHEPVIPAFVDLVVTTAGLDVIGKPLTSEYCHRAELAKSLLGIDGDQNVTAEIVASLLQSPIGGLKGVPSGAISRVLLTHLRTNNDLEHGRRIATQLLNSNILSVSLGALKHDAPIAESHNRVAGIILAAGSSTRLDGPKQMLPFKGKPLYQHAIAAALDGGLSPIIVITSEGGEAMQPNLDGPAVEFVQNLNPDLGQSSSLVVGLNQLGGEVEGAIFLLADMPLINGRLVRALRQRHAETLAPIVVPYAQGKRGNPVLFDRGAFDALRKLKGDRGGRGIFSNFAHERIEWDTSIHFDIDTPDDLQRLQELE